MKGIIGFFRNTLAFVLFALTFGAVSILAFLVIYFLNHKLDHTRALFAAPWSVAIGSWFGIRMGVAMLDRWFEPYPKRLFGGLFIGIWGGLTVLAIIGDVVRQEPWTFKDFTSALGVVVACITAWAFLWRRPAPLPDIKPQAT
jgi:hypothetical protein